MEANIIEIAHDVIRVAIGLGILCVLQHLITKGK